VLVDEILKSESLLTLENLLRQEHSILIEELWNSPKALIASIAQKATGKHILLLTGASQEEIQLFHDFPCFTDSPVSDFPAWETLPIENISPSPDIVGERYKVLHDLKDSNRPRILISNLQACLQRLLPPERFETLYLLLRKGADFPFEKLLANLKEMGYQRRPVASDKGEFAVRGGIVDIFPVSSPDPFRIEFWGDEIESIRIYDPIGQKSVRSVEEAAIPPAQEKELLDSSTALCSILDYLGPNTLVIFDDLLALEDRYASLLQICGTPSRSFSSIEAFMEQIAPLQTIYWTQSPLEELTKVKLLEKQAKSYYSKTGGTSSISFSMFNRDLSAVRWQHPFISIPDWLFPDSPESTVLSGNDILRAVGRLRDSPCRLHFLCSTELEQSALHNRLVEASLVLPKHSSYRIGYLSSGFFVEDIEEALLPMTEITHRYKIRRQKQRSTYHSTPFQAYDLAPGELVVHYNNGIGRFIGLEKKPNNLGIPTEFFAIEFAEKSKLYVPLNQAHLISKYIGASDELPRLHTIGSSRWKKTKEQTERAILHYAADLLELYAKREVREGFIYPEDSEDVKAFEEDFPYVETEDQLEAIRSFKVDMCSKKSMDRLICGDVGYGKTEVAMRAAFKAVLDGEKQVAVLVPTTVLAMQHYENFLDRMANFPLTIEVLSRFRTPKQVRDILERTAAGTIDILIGTHRIISDDVVFKKLGLVIIDEEQRFGVKAKEHLKTIKTTVDCLTLSATPIPRTLYMSLIGARDMSVINTPPQDRLPITTIIAEPHDQVIKNALLRELARDGQAYFIHNRVESIFEVAARLKKLLPQARIVVGHGQMTPDEIDSVFHAFKSGRADILVATTIVENGIDIPNANTILIDRSDQFGLADLYQLRGRVGRWNRRAYAYFLVPNQRTMPEIARKRLQALAESSGYGGGMKVAMRDLEIRGAGNILGMEQSGHVSAIGFHLYCKLLQRTIQAMKGDIPSVLTDTKMEFPAIDARLPEDYVNEITLRMEVYQRLGEAITLEDVDLLWNEVQDRFGPAPESASWLYHLTRLRVYASSQGFTALKFEKMSLTIEKNKDKNAIVRKVLLPKYKTPVEFEKKVVKILDETQ
jgi:transcription-repair coupling factor (superfamily II helicase)